MNDNKKIINNSKDKVLGRTNMNYPIYVDQLTNEDSLKEVLYNMYDSQDEVLTKDGINFLNENYGIDKITAIILEEKSSGKNYHFSTEKDVAEWLQRVENINLQ